MKNQQAIDNFLSSMDTSIDQNIHIMNLLRDAYLNKWDQEVIQEIADRNVRKYGLVDE